MKLNAAYTWKPNLRAAAIMIFGSIRIGGGRSGGGGFAYTGGGGTIAGEASGIDDSAGSINGRRPNPDLRGRWPTRCSRDWR